MTLKCPITHDTSWHPLCEQQGHQWIRFDKSGFVQMRETPTLAASSEIQSEDVGQSYIAGYDRKLASKQQRSRRRVRYLKRFMTGPRLLDVGSNVGIFVDQACRLGLEAEGLEISDTLWRYACTRYPDYTFHKTALEDFSSPEQFDGIYCSEVIEHSADVEGFATSLFDHLKPGGALYLTTPSLDEYVRADVVVRSLGAPDHKLYFTKRNIGAFLKRFGFSKVRHKWGTGRGIQLIAIK